MEKASLIMRDDDEIEQKLTKEGEDILPSSDAESVLRSYCAEDCS